MRLSRRLFGPLCALLLGLGCVSCNNTPTLPLPPPVAQATLDETGFALVVGEVHPLAYVSVLNERTDQGVITRGNQEGHFETRIEAEVGDQLTVWQDLGGEISEPKYTTVQRMR